MGWTWCLPAPNTGGRCPCWVFGVLGRWQEGGCHLVLSSLQAEGSAVSAACLCAVGICVLLRSLGSQGIKDLQGFLTAGCRVTHWELREGTACSLPSREVTNLAKMSEPVWKSAWNSDLACCLCSGSSAAERTCPGYRSSQAMRMVRPVKLALRLASNFHLDYHSKATVPYP
jgi:hypothetical protein